MDELLGKWVMKEKGDMVEYCTRGDSFQELRDYLITKIRQNVPVGEKGFFVIVTVNEEAEETIQDSGWIGGEVQ